MSPHTRVYIPVGEERNTHTPINKYTYTYVHTHVHTYFRLGYEENKAR